MNTTSRHRTSNPNALSGLDHKGFDAFPHQIYKGAKTQGILTNMPSYLNNGIEQMKSSERALEVLPEPNKQYAKDFENYLQVLNRNPKTIGRRMLELAWLLKHLGKDAKQATKKDIENLVLQINNSNYAQISKGKLKLTLKRFYKWLYESDYYPELVSWIKTDRGKTTKKASDLLTEDEVKQLIAACLNSRDRALIALLYDSGMRVGELLGLRIKDLQIGKDISFVNVDGKTGVRRIPIGFSLPYLTNYIGEMRQKAKENDYLFVKFDHFRVTENALDYDDIRKILHDLKERTGIQKRLHPHLFRHSRATELASKLTESQMRLFFGWTAGSTMTATYVHLSDRDLLSAMKQINGMAEAKPEPPKLKVVVCPRCHEQNEVTAHYCRRCGYDLTKSAVEQINDLEKMQQEIEQLKEEILMLYNYLPVQEKKQIEELRKQIKEVKAED